VLPRRFALVRHVDYTGVSGIGVVAYGIAFSDGHVALRWCSSHPATSIWESLDHMLAVHGHGEATSIQWIDTPVRDLEGLPGTSGSGRRARRRAAQPANEPEGIPDRLPNGYGRPSDTPIDDVLDTRPGEGPTSAVPRPRAPGRHRRADQEIPR
jgi:hypothetical protein